MFLRKMVTSDAVQLIVSTAASQQGTLVEPFESN